MLGALRGVLEALRPPRTHLPQSGGGPARELEAEAADTIGVDGDRVLVSTPRRSSGCTGEALD